MADRTAAPPPRAPTTATTREMAARDVACWCGEPGTMGCQGCDRVQYCCLAHRYKDCLQKKCSWCGTATRKQCRGCLHVRYCSEEHQARDWRHHKKSCPGMHGRPRWTTRHRANCRFNQYFQQKRTCKLCGSFARHRCTGCDLVYYCNQDHQRQDRDAHRAMCGTQSGSE